MRSSGSCITTASGVPISECALLSAAVNCGFDGECVDDAVAVDSLCSSIDLSLLFGFWLLVLSGVNRLSRVLCAR